MLKSYEAVYNNGQFRWLGQIPLLPAKEVRMLVVIEVTSLLSVSQESLAKMSPSSPVDLDLKEMWQEWKNQNGGPKKPQGGKLRPKLQGKTAAQCVLEDRG